MHYTVYQTTNLINGKIYIGQHVSTKPFLFTKYYGSNKQLRADIKELGRDSFKREVRYNCRNNDELDVVEAALVDREFVNRSDTYNKQIGGGNNRVIVGKAMRNKSPEHVSSLSASLTERNKHKSPEHKEIQRAASSKAASNKSPEHKAAIISAQTKVHTCPHCSKVGKGNAMLGYHFNNCKHRFTVDSTHILASLWTK